MECNFRDLKHIDGDILTRVLTVKHIDGDILTRVLTVLYRVNDDSLHLSVSEQGLCITKYLANKNYIKMYPHKEKVICNIYDHRAQLIETKTLKW